jgi:hypothetical protein
VGPGVDDARADEEELGTGGEVEIDLPGDAADAVPLVESEDGGVVGGDDFGCEERGAGGGAVGDEGDVPFDAAGEPGVSAGEVGGAEDGVFVEEFAVGFFVDEGPEASTEFEEEGGAEMIVFEDGDFEIAGVEAAVVLVLEEVGEAHLVLRRDEGIFFAVVACAGVGADVAEGGQGWEGIFAAEVGGGHGEFFDAEVGHGNILQCVRKAKRSREDVETQYIG